VRKKEEIQSAKKSSGQKLGLRECFRPAQKKRKGEKKIPSSLTNPQRKKGGYKGEEVRAPLIRER